MHVIAAKAVAFHEALQPAFRTYQVQVVRNAKVLADELIKQGFHVVSGGTDNHLVLVEVKSLTGLTGKDAEQLLDTVHITCNKNTVPNDTEKPFITSGIRLGTPAITTRGFTEDDVRQVARLLHRTLMHPNDEQVLEDVRRQVAILTENHPLY
jgi:glycine hydroxymethyltransferase